MDPDTSSARHQIVSYVDAAFVDDEAYEGYTELGCEYTQTQGQPVMTTTSFNAPAKQTQGTTKPLILRVVKEVTSDGDKEPKQEVLLKPVVSNFDNSMKTENDEPPDASNSEEEARREANKISQELLTGLVVYYVRPSGSQEIMQDNEIDMREGHNQESENVILPSSAVGAEVADEEYDTDEKRTKYVCHICKLNFTAGAEHRYHMRAFHNATAARPCPVCSKPFYNTTDLRNHVMAHKGIKPYKCHVCGHSFTVKSNLTNHMLRHGPLDYECKICGKRLAQPASLKKHLKSHAGNKPFHCEVCDKRFLQKGDLTRHQLVHNGQRDFQCDLCEKMFSLKANLQTHRRKVHGYDTQ